MRIGVDLGGTKIEAVAIDEMGKQLWRNRVPTPVGDYAGTLHVIGDLVRRIETELSRTGTVGVGSPGAISLRTGLLKNSSSAVLNGKALDVDLSRLLARRVRVGNDANCLALSEAIDGTAADANVVFGAILGTGVGGGIVIGKQIIAGRNKIAGEWGHNPLPWATATERTGRPCYCGKSDCVETFLSGAGLSREYFARSNRQLDAQEISLAAAAGDAAARDSLSAYQDRLARSLAALINILDPDVIVLGGGLSNIKQVCEGLTARVAAYAFSDGLDTPIVHAAHGDSSGVRGAAWLR